MEQHNHHCALSFSGYNWWILWCAKNRIGVARRINSSTVLTTVIDTSEVDWEAYCTTAVAWDYNAY
jgi:hypothetical protein